MKRSSPHAFTLLEIMIAMAILGGGLVVLLTSVFHSIRMYRVAQETLLGGFLAQEKYTEVINSKTPVAIGDYKDGVFEKAPDYRWRYRVDKVGLQPFMETIPGLRRVEVVVSWGDEHERHVDVVSYVRDREQRPSQ